MKLTPVKKITFIASAVCAALGLAGFFTGHFVASSIFGLCAAINLLSGIVLKKY